MMNDCPICGKNHVITWPEFWPYRHGEIFFCSDQCLDVYNVRVLHKTNGWIPDKKKGKTKKMGYAKVKKDGSPAKKSGPKPKKLETPAYEVTKAALQHPEQPIVQIEGHAIAKEIEKGFTPEEIKMIEKGVIPTEKKPKKMFSLPATCQGFEIVGIRGQYGVYKANDEVKYFDFQPFGGELCMTPEEWHEQLDELQRAAKVLGVEL